VPPLLTGAHYRELHLPLVETPAEVTAIFRSMGMKMAGHSTAGAYGSHLVIFTVTDETGQSDDFVFGDDLAVLKGLRGAEEH
jgi:hypothetical protein